MYVRVGSGVKPCVCWGGGAIIVGMYLCIYMVIDRCPRTPTTGPQFQLTPTPFSRPRRHRYNNNAIFQL